MTIQDLQYITVIAESDSIGKAAGKLHVAQPSLSKCIQKVEREYDIVLFRRIKGVSAKLTPEGELFIGMGREILLSHARFKEQLRRMKELQKNTLTLGLTYQRTVDFAGPILERFYKLNPQQILQIQTRDTFALQQGVLDRTLDMAVFAAMDRHDEIYYEPILQSCFGVYLREGSPVAAKAVRLDGYDYPVLRLEDLAGERFTVNKPGSASWAIVEEMIRKSGIPLEIMDVMNNQSRIAMVTSGIASAFAPISEKPSGKREVEDRLYIIHPEQNVNYQVCIACLNGFQYSRVFKTVVALIKELIHQ